MNSDRPDNNTARDPGWISARLQTALDSGSDPADFRHEISTLANELRMFSREASEFRGTLCGLMPGLYWQPTAAGFKGDNLARTVPIGSVADSAHHAGLTQTYQSDTMVMWNGQIDGWPVHVSYFTQAGRLEDGEPATPESDTVTPEGVASAPSMGIKPGVHLRNPNGDEVRVISAAPGRPVGEWYVSAPNPGFGPRRYVATEEELRAGSYAPVGGAGEVSVEAPG